MPIKTIEEILGLSEENNVSELVLENKKFTIKVKRNIHLSKYSDTDQISSEIEMTENKKYITSKMIGRFHIVDVKKNTHFVENGTKVKKGSILGQVESMKIRRDIIADFDMSIKNILIENNGTIEYGQKIFEIEREKSV